jgi:AraC-like DNA-binding protein
MDQLYFSIPEILSLIGVTQCVYLIVYMMFRAGKLSRAGLPLAYFSVLALAFISDFAAARFSSYYDYYFYFQWATWFLGPPLSVLLLIQIAQIYKTPSWKHYWVLLLVPFAFAIAAVATPDDAACHKFLPCEDMHKILTLTGLIAGALSLLSIWLNRDLLSDMDDRKTGKDRYWLVLAIIFMNIAFLGTMLVSLSAGVDAGKISLVRTVIGLGFIYLVTTSLFRLYPQAVLMAGTEKTEKLTDEELAIAQKVEKLLAQDKVYQEASYARTDLARECGTSEAIISKIINIYFRKSFPQIINEHRVEDAKRLLDQTEANIKVIAEEVGFNSVASFNRAFREIAGEAPSTYRKRAKH